MEKVLINKLILGTVQMGLAYGVNNSAGKINLDDSLEILEFAFEQGIEILDTAEAYGNAHAIIGTFHEKNPNRKFKIITKLPNQINTTIVEKVDAYLNELKVDRLHALLFHSFSSYLDNIDSISILKKLKLDKKIDNLGVSVYTNAEIEAVILNKDINIIQLPFNLFDNSNLRGELLEKIKASGKTVHTRSAVLQGLFFKDSQEQNAIVQQLKTEMNLIAAISKTENISIAALALRYCLQQNTIDNVLIGVDSLNQLRDNIKALNYSITPETIARINTIKVKNIAVLNPSLWK